MSEGERDCCRVLCRFPKGTPPPNGRTDQKWLKELRQQEGEAKVGAGRGTEATATAGKTAAEVAARWAG